MAIWRLKKGEDRRFRSGHPWVYSNELQGSPKGVQPGELLELHDPGGEFLARGYANPSSLIAFRVLSRDPEEKEVGSAEFVLKRLRSASSLRKRVGFGEVSHRLCFGEADGLPGLIIDCYRVKGEGSVFVVQPHTAGMDRMLPSVIEALKEYDPEHRAIVIRHDAGLRTLEGLTENPTEVIGKEAGLRQAKIELRGGISLQADLIGGQKTGFFLDQSANIELAIERLCQVRGKGEIKILDLCSYVGHWGAQFAAHLKRAGFTPSVTAMDASATALELARANVESQGGKFTGIKGDVLEDLTQAVPNASFDIVISDPPALIKGRKAFPQGKHAYVQLNTQAIAKVKAGGGFVSCSCSALLQEDELVEILAKSARRAQRRVHWIARGGQAPDHPILAEFPEGRYLKCWVGVVE